MAYISLPWIQLTTLQLQWLQSLREYLEILRHTPTLEELSVSIGPLTSTQPFTSAPCLLPHLHNLTLRSPHGSSLFKYLTLPALQQLDLWRPSEGCARRVDSLVQRSGCIPRTLILREAGIETGLDSMYECISILPSIRALTLSCTFFDDANMATLFHYMAEENLLPALEVLNLEYCGDPHALHELSGLLSRRRANTGADGVAAAKIQAIRLSYGNHEWDGMVDDALDAMREIRAEGLKIDLPSGPKRHMQEFGSQMVCASSCYPPRTRSELPPSFGGLDTRARSNRPCYIRRTSFLLTLVPVFLVYSEQFLFIVYATGPDGFMFTLKCGNLRCESYIKRVI